MGFDGFRWKILVENSQCFWGKSGKKCWMNFQIYGTSAGLTRILWEFWWMHWINSQMYVKFAGILLDELEIYGNFGGSTQIVWELWWINSQIYEKFGGFTAHLWDIWWINSNLWQLDEKYDDAWWFQWDLVGLNGKKKHWTKWGRNLPLMATSWGLTNRNSDIWENIMVIYGDISSIIMLFGVWTCGIRYTQVVAICAFV